MPTNDPGFADLPGASPIPGRTIERLLPPGLDRLAGQLGAAAPSWPLFLGLPPTLDPRPVRQSTRALPSPTPMLGVSSPQLVSSAYAARSGQLVCFACKVYGRGMAWPKRQWRA
jgi:hypothetical protein